MDYINDKEVEMLGSPLGNNGEIIETDDDDDDEKDVETYDSHFESNSEIIEPAAEYDGHKWNDQYESWNQYEVYKGLNRLFVYIFPSV